MKSDYKRFRTKIFFRLLFLSAIAVVVGLIILRFLIDGVFQDAFADGFLYISQKILGLTRTEAYRLYQQLIRNNKSVFIITGFVFLLLVFFFFAIIKFTTYFREINQGIEQLTVKDDKLIVLSDELEFAEKKLNEVKNILKERERAILESEKKKNELIMYLAHDMKTPLTSVIGYLSLLDEAKSLPAEQREAYIQTALRKAQDLGERMNEFFDITRFHLQEITLDKKSVNLTIMLRQIADEFYPLFEKKQIECQLNLEEGVRVQADADKLARVFDNILKNAAAYADPKSIVLIRMLYSEKNVAIHISNKGKQIPKEKLDRIFERFYRVDESRSRDTGGTGLGLAIAKEIVQLHGGKIQAISEEERTEFIVNLPAL